MFHRFILSFAILACVSLSRAKEADQKHTSLQEAQAIIDREKIGVKGRVELAALNEIRKLAMAYPKVADTVGFKIANGGGRDVGGDNMLAVALHYGAVDCKWNERLLRKRYPALYQTGGVFGFIYYSPSKAALLMSPNRVGWGFFIEGVIDGEDVSEFGAFGQGAPLTEWKLVDSDNHFYLMTSRPLRPAAGDKYLLEERKYWRVDNFKFEDERTIQIRHSLKWRPKKTNAMPGK